MAAMGNRLFVTCQKMCRDDPFINLLKYLNVMIYVVAHNFVKPEHLDEFKQLAKTLVEASRQESGNVFYDLNTDSVDPYRLTFIEGWKDDDASSFHQNTEHFKSLLPKLKAWCVDGGSITQYFPIDF